MKKRNTSLDILRFIAITCIILLHVIAIFRYKYFLNNQNYFLLFTFLDVFTRIGVPIFFMLTGILMLNKEEEGYKSFIKKRIPKLLISYIVFSFLYIIYDIVVLKTNISFKDMIQIITSRLASYHLWFMPIIILLYVFIPFIKKMVENLSKKDLNSLIMVNFILGNLLSAIVIITSNLGRPLFNNFRLPNLLIYGNYLLIGYYLNKYKPKISIKIAMISLISIIVIPLLTKYLSVSEINDFFLDSCSPFVVFLSTWIMQLFINKKRTINNDRTMSFLENISKVSLYMYLIHFLIINIISNRIHNTILNTSLLGDIALLVTIFSNVWIVSYIISTLIDRVVYLIKKNHNKISNKLIKLFMIIFAIIFIYVAFSLIINHYKFTSFNYLYLFLSTISIIGLAFIINKCKEKLFNNKIINVLLIILYIIFQILIIYLFRVKPSWDFGEVFNIANDVAAGTRQFNTIYYLYICDNNIPLTLVLVILIKPLFILGLGKYSLIFMFILNILAIDISLYFLYKLISRINSKYSLVFLIFSLFFSPLVFYLPIFYTDTLTIPFVIIPLFYLYKYLFEKEKIIYLIISGLLLSIGTLFKATVAIILIAFIITVILNKRIKFKRLLLLLIIFIIPIVLSKIYISKAFDNYEMERNRKPLTHFIMMGLSESGGFNDQDMEFTTNIISFNEKKEKTIEKIKERLYNYYKGHKIIEFYNKKINYTWADGTFFAPNKLARSPINQKYQKYIQENYKESWLYLNMSNASWLIIIILMVIGVLFRKNLSERQKTIQLIVNLSIFGLFIFLLIWETRSRYLVNFTPLFLISSYIGLNAIINFIKSKKIGE